jgi:hypothetical protein
MIGSTGYFSTDTDDKVAILEAMWRAGDSAREIAAALHERFGGTVTRNMVVGKAHRLCLPMHQSAHKWRFQGPGRKCA